jgi:5'-methylthioadenosine phosphorylase
MPKTAVIIGECSEELLKGFEQVIVKTMYGNVILYVNGKNIILLRNGKSKNIPSYRVNNKANICALNTYGVEKIIGIEKAESLNQKIREEELITLKDYVDFSPESFFEFEIRETVPGFHDMLAKEIKLLAKKAKLSLKEAAVYVQVKHSRKFSNAELRVIKNWGDIVGGNIASEATLCREVGIPYTPVCEVKGVAELFSKQKKKEARKKKGKINKSEKLIKEIFKKNMK